MLPHSTPNRIPLAAAAEVAARLPGTRWGRRRLPHPRLLPRQRRQAYVGIAGIQRPPQARRTVPARPLLQMQAQHAGRTRRHPPRPAKSDRPAAVQLSRLQGSATIGPASGWRDYPPCRPQTARAGHDTACAAAPR